MNQNLMQINNNCGVVSDEDGNISVIKKENDLYDFEKILLKENELETLELKLKNSKKELSDNKWIMKHDAILSVLLIVIEIVMFALGYSLYPLKKLIATTAISYLHIKVIFSIAAGLAYWFDKKTFSIAACTKIGRYFKKKKLTAAIEKMELNIITLKKELEEIKEKSKYKVEYQTATKSNEKTVSEEIYHEVSMPIDNISKRNNKVRILSLAKTKKL